MDIICDIDGTIADCSHRLHFIKQKPKDWESFFAGIPEDKPIEPVIELLRFNSVIYVSGRPERCRKDTLAWLSKHQLQGCFGQYELFLRPDMDRRPDYMVKEDLLKVVKAYGWNPVLAIEDRQQCVDMYRRNGLICLQTCEGNY